MRTEGGDVATGMTRVCPVECGGSFLIPEGQPVNMAQTRSLQVVVRTSSLYRPCLQVP